MRHLRALLGDAFFEQVFDERILLGRNSLPGGFDHLLVTVRASLLPDELVGLQEFLLDLKFAHVFQDGSQVGPRLMRLVRAGGRKGIDLCRWIGGRQRL